MSRRGLQMIALLGFFLASASRGQLCPPHGRPASGPNAEFFPFLGLTTPTDQGGLGIGTVTIYLDDSARNAFFFNEQQVKDAATDWSACAGASTPDFALNATDKRPPVSEGFNLQSTILINFIDGPAPSDHLASWNPADNSITLYSRCPLDGTHGLPCANDMPNGAILWNTPGLLSTVIAHEIGHAAGLEDEAPSDSCTNGVMQSPIGPNDTNLEVTILYCRLTNSVNDFNSPCNGEQPATGESHPCDSEARIARGGPGGPGGVGSGLGDLFCEEFSWLCDNGNPWSGSGIDCNWGCSSYSDNFGNSGSSCSWGCFAAAFATTTESTTTVEGLAPFLALTSPTHDATVRGVVTLTGFSMDFNGIASVSFGIDGQPVTVGKYSGGLSSPEACSLPLGLDHVACDPNSGFSAVLDTTLLPNGPHVLSVVSYDTTGWTTSVEVPIVVDNPVCEQVAPAVSITAPANGSTVTGTVSVTANASDNVGVTKVELYVNSSLTATDTTAPYSFNWNTGSLASGAYNLKAKAFDACNNSTTSATVNVTLQQDTSVPQATWTAPASGAVVRGTVSLQAQASDDIGVTRVEFYVNGALQGTDTTAPYGINWNTTSLADGSYNLHAKAFDASAKNGTSATVTVKVDNTVPRAYFDVPAHNATVSGTAVQLAGWATDLSRITSLTFKLDGQPLPLNSPYTYGLNRQDVCNVYPGDPSCPYVGWGAIFDSTRFVGGSHTVEVIATDGAGLTVTAQRVINISNDVSTPTVSITAPGNGSTVKGIITVQASASDNIGVTRVEFLVNNVLKATDTTSPYSFSWDTTTAAEGGASVVAKAYDAGGNTGTSSISVTVDNLQPKIRIMADDGSTVSVGMTSVFPSTPAGASVSRLFTIYNDGNETLQIQNPSGLVSGSGFSLIVTPPSQIAPASSAVFRVRLLSSTAGTYNGTVSVQNSDPTKNPFTFYVTGTVTPPPPVYEGYHEILGCYYAVGWAWDSNRPNDPINVEVYDGTTLLGSTPANFFRQDLLNAGKGNGYHGFTFSLPSSVRSGSAHSISVKFGGTATNLGLSPRSVTCQSLSVSKAGTGAGTVTSNPAGISCGSDCSEFYSANTSVTLTASPGSGSTFGGWSGNADCSDGVVTLSASRSCTATFAAAVRVIWLQPQALAGFGTPGSLVMAGSATNAPPGTSVRVTWRDVTAGGPWTTEPYQPIPDANGYWVHEILNANYSHQYAVTATFGATTSVTCTYPGNGTSYYCP